MMDENCIEITKQIIESDGPFRSLQLFHCLLNKIQMGDTGIKNYLRPLYDFAAFFIRHFSSIVQLLTKDLVY